MTDRESSPNMGLLQKKYETGAGRLTRFAITRFYAALTGMLDKAGAHTVFDAGCGEGHILHQFLDSRYNAVYGADLDMARLEYTRQQQPDAAVFCGNLHHIPLPDGAVDLVICLEVLEHVGQPEIALRELHRVTRRYAILSVPNEPFWRIGNMARGAYLKAWGNTPEHINHWSYWGFKRFVGQYFRVIDTATPVTWTFVLAEK
jgi:2-polyprenyl-3-methyl-5-hydroxy-6-metoxy-1,4-benzoquinol methylase